MHRICALIFTSALCSAMAACGGSDDPVAPSGAAGASGAAATGTLTFSTVQGAYAGRIAASTARALILENGDFWLIPGAVLENGAYTPSGVGRVQAQLDNNRISADFVDSSLTAAVDSTRMAGSLTTKSIPPQTFEVELTKGNFTGYNYNAPASLAAIAGTGWTSTTSTTQTAITIGTNGVVPLGAVPIAPGCAGNISLTPRASGKNVFDATIPPATCAAVTRPGIALNYTDDTGRGQLLILFSTATGGFFLTATR